MKASIKHQNSDIPKKDYKLFEDFIKFLNKEYPLKHQIEIIFTGERIGGMTTGSRTTEHTLKVLSKGRLNRDIMRTLAHEWVHEYQHGVLNREKGPDIGGRNEDEANAFAGRLIKMFEKSYPQYDKEIFEGFKTIVNKLDILSEQIILSEKETIRQKFLTEMKEFGIDKLPYSYSAIKRFVDPETMDIHYNKHYKGYVKKLNDALSKKKGEMSLEDIIKSISKFDTKVRNNAGGAFNHALFWKMLSPKKQTPNGKVYDKIIKQYGSFDKFKEEFNKVALDRFGSGWVWLILTKTNRLKVMSTPNQDNPLMNVVDGGGYPLLGLDVWEHAYYLRYRNKRDQYINKFWNCVNWDFVNELFELKTNKKETITESVDNISKSALKFLNKLYGNLTKVVIDDVTYYVDENRNIIITYNLKQKLTEDIGYVYINYDRIWEFLISTFNLNISQAEEILTIWLEETYGIRGFVPFSSDNRINRPLEESITENKKESLQDKLKNIVKNVGPKQASDIVGGAENLLKLAFNDKPMEFLHLFDNLDVVQSEEMSNWILFRYKKGENLMIYDKKENVFYISYIKFWAFLQNFYSENEIKLIIKKWLSEIYNLNGIGVVSSGVGKNLGWMGNKN